MARRWLRRIGWITGAALLLAGAAVALDRAFPPDLSRLHATGTEILDREGCTLSVLPAPGGVWRLRTQAEDVPPALVALLVAAEDRRFWWHPGVDPIALVRAAVQWVRAGGRVVSGGSTLTMQAARLLEPRPRTLRSKLVEIARAAQLEARFSKREILGIWLTLAPQGGNIEGMRAGALAWFGRPAARLDPAEAALLVAIPRRPAALRPDRHPERARAAQDGLLRHRAGPLAAVTEADRARAFATPVPAWRQRFPQFAPHLARELGRGAGEGRIATTLDLPLQRAAESVAHAALDTLPERAAVALIVADLATREVRALVGGAWGEEARVGALDLTRAVRSPGSALKPFLYALAFESGAAAPQAIVSDLPLRFGAYAPENYDRGFAGRVTAAEALRLSLNLPAVALLEQVGPLRFAAALKAAGAPPRLAPGAAPSLPLALGGAGTTLREMTALYATLGGGGVAAPLRILPGGAGAPMRQVVEARAATAVAGVLVQPFPGGGPQGVAWKTGTSWGGRDAWAFGFDGAHMAGVWAGRPDGTPLPGATGRNLALPVLARVFHLLPPAPLPSLAVRPSVAVGDAPDRLRLLFPPPGAVLGGGSSDGDASGPVTLRAAGGRRPLTFLVDGAPLSGTERAKREARWAPPGPGFYRVTVLDADGVAARAEVRVR